MWSIKGKTVTSPEACGAKSKEGRVWQMQLVGSAVAVMSCATLGNFLSFSEPWFSKSSFLKDCRLYRVMDTKKPWAVRVRCAQVRLSATWTWKAGAKGGEKEGRACGGGAGEGEKE